MDELRDTVDVHFLFAERMIDQAFFELTQKRPLQTRVLICRAIDQLDRALGEIWEAEQHESGAKPDDRGQEDA